MLYSTAYNLQIDGFNKQTNQTVGIALCFFIHGLDNLFI